MKSKAQNERYSRQVLLHDFGETGQQKLLDAKVLVIGAGGLGCPVLQYLAAAGVGTIGIADADVVSLSNLQRQVLYTTRDVGKSKAAAVANRLRQMNPDIMVNRHQVHVDNQNALDLFAGYDYIIDGTDNFATRYLINDACVLLGKPLVFGAVYQYEGQVAIFNVEDNDGARIQYRHLFPAPPSAEEAPDCATAGVLGTLPGLIGIMQATEVIKLITGIGCPLTGKMLTYNMRTNESMIIDLSAAATMEIDMPHTREEYQSMNYEAFCGSKMSDVQQIDATTFMTLLSNEGVAIIDVRETTEMPPATFRHRQIPMSVLHEKLDTIVAEKVVFFCQSGIRSRLAAGLLGTHFKNQKQVYSLDGGMAALKI